MKRQIKFKAWHLSLEVMLNVYVIDQTDNAIGEPYSSGCKGWYGDNIQIEFKYNEVEWLQFTGLTDKNGKEIYEGDIYREETEYDEGDMRDYYVCVYIKEWCRFAFLHLPEEYENYLDSGIEKLDHSLQETFGVFEDEMDKMAICGNMYEHSNLLIPV